MKSRPDLIVLLLLVFSLGVAATLLVPASASQSATEPASALHAGVFTRSKTHSKPQSD